MSWNLQLGPYKVSETIEKCDAFAKDADPQLAAALEAAKGLLAHIGNEFAQVTVYGQEALEGSTGGDSHIHVSVASFAEPTTTTAALVGGSNVVTGPVGPIVAEGSEQPPPSPPSAPEQVQPVDNEVPSHVDPLGVDGGTPAAPDEGPDAAEGSGNEVAE